MADQRTSSLTPAQAAQFWKTCIRRELDTSDRLLTELEERRRQRELRRSRLLGAGQLNGRSHGDHDAPVPDATRPSTAQSAPPCSPLAVPSTSGRSALQAQLHALRSRVQQERRAARDAQALVAEMHALQRRLAEYEGALARRARGMQ